jgi:hypothetical protein
MNMKFDQPTMCQSKICLVYVKKKKKEEEEEALLWLWIAKDDDITPPSHMFLDVFLWVKLVGHITLRLSCNLSYWEHHQSTSPTTSWLHHGFPL